MYFKDPYHNNKSFSWFVENMLRGLFQSNCCRTEFGDDVVKFNPKLSMGNFLLAQRDFICTFRKNAIS